jgi:hypothetical protein
MKIAAIALLFALLAGCQATGSGAGRVVRDTTHVTLSLRIGGSEREMGRDVAFLPDGDLVTVGSTFSPDFPVSSGAWDTALHVGAKMSDGWLARFSPDGTRRWATYLGSPNYERIYAVEVAPSGDLVVAGRGGEGLPRTTATAQPEFGGGTRPAYGPQDGFVCRVTPDGREVRFCTYFGTADNSIIRDVAVDSAGDIFVAAGWEAGEFPSEWFTHAFQPRPRGGEEIVIAKIAGDGSRVLWATFLGGSDAETGAPSIRIGPGGTPYVLITTQSSDMPTPNGFDHTLDGKLDLYVARLSADGSRLLYGTYLGGSGNEDIETHGLAVDAQGIAYVGGGTTSMDFPTTPGAVRTAQDRSSGDPGDAILAKISADGSRLLAATYVGGRAREGGEGLGIDAEGNAYLTGGTSSDDFPTVAPHDGGEAADLFAVKLSPDLSRTLFSIRLGGAKDDRGRALAVTPDGRVLITGTAQSEDWPLRGAPMQPRRGADDAIVVLLRP